MAGCQADSGHRMTPDAGVVRIHRGEDPRGRGQAERQHGVAVELALPLEAEVGERRRVHVDMVVGAGNVNSATPPGPLEEGSALPLEGLHAEWLLREVLVDVRAVPHESGLAGAVECDLQREGTHHICGTARLHGAGRYPLGNGFRHETRVGERCRAVREPHWAWRAEFGVPF